MNDVLMEFLRVRVKVCLDKQVFFGRPKIGNSVHYGTAVNFNMMFIAMKESPSHKRHR
jgi:hypothetical protein